MFDDKNPNNLSYIKRTYFFVIIMLFFFVIAIFKLVDLQIIRCNYFERLAENKNKTRQLIPAARGDIIDRNGVVLATNILKLSLVIDSSFPLKSNKDDDETKIYKNHLGNEIIFNLIKILENNGLEYDKTFPITKIPPYQFLPDKKNEEIKLKHELNQQPFATAVDVLNLLVKNYNIDGYNQLDTVKIAAMRANMLLSNFNQTKIFTVIDSIEPEYVEKFIGTKLNLQGVNINETSSRFYPCEDVAAHIIGTIGPIYSEEMEKLKDLNYTPDAFIGKWGVEKQFEKFLRSYDGYITIERLKNGEVKRYYEPNDEPKPGNIVRLTIDYELQKQIQEELKTFMKNTAPANKSAAVVVLDVKTGEILALVSLPSFDLNDYSKHYNQLLKAPGNPLKNQTLELYRPGSTFKTFMAAAGILSGKISPSTTFRCYNGAFPKMGCIQSSHHGSHTIDIYKALQFSCNNYFYNVARTMKIETIDEYAPYFGFATDTGLELYNVDGRVTNPAYYAKHGLQYQQGFTWQTGIGQADVYVTPLQMAISQMTIANKGTRFATHILKSVESFDENKVIFQTEPKILSELNSNSVAWETVLKGMKLMAKTRPPLANLDIATKSGSPEYTNFSKNKTNAAGVGFYPANFHEAEIAMSIMVQDGRHGEDFLGTIAKIYNNLKKQRSSY